MALVTKRNPVQAPQRVVRYCDESAGDTALTVSPPDLVLQELLFVTIVYSATVTVDPTITLNSGKGANWDTLLQTLDSGAGATDFLWIPDERIWFLDDDVLDVLAPAGGGVITSNIAVYMRTF